MLAVVLALLSSISWGTADFIGGLKSRQLPLLTVLLTTEIVGTFVIGAAVLVRGEGPPGGDFAIYAGLAGLAGTVGIAAFFRAMSIGKMSVIAPISATAAIIPVAVGVATGENLAALQGVGIALALAGVMLASREAEVESVRSHRLVAGVGMALLAAVGFGSFFLAMDAASSDDVLWAVFVNRCTSVTIVAAVALALRSPPRFGRADVPALVAVDLLTVAGIGLFSLASTEGLLSIVSVISALYPVTTIVLAHLVLRERIFKAQRVGVVLALAGVALISAG